jgi:hypothetical protein
MITDQQLETFCAACAENYITWSYKDAQGSLAMEQSPQGETPEQFALRVHGFKGFAFKRGPKFTRIEGGGSVTCFVDNENGNILKAAGVKGPEPKRHVRGNIANGAGDLSPFGTPKYLR